MENKTAYTSDETGELLRAKVQETGMDSFWVRVSRRRPPGIPEIVASLEEATLENCVRPEAWLPQLAGGGAYYLSIGHTTEPGRTVGSSITVTFSGEPRNVDPYIIQAEDWRGPKKLTHPTVKTGEPIYAAGFVPPARGIHMTEGTTPVGGANLELDFLRREMAAREKEAERRERLFMDQLQQLRARPEPRMDVAAMLAAGAPIVTAMMNTAAESRRLQMEAMQRQAEQNQTLMTTLLTREQKPDPSLGQVVEILKHSNEKNQKMLEKMAEGGHEPDRLEETQRMIGMFHDMMSLVVKASNTAAEVVAERPTNVWKDIIGALEGVAQKAFAGASAGQLRVPQMQQLPQQAIQVQQFQPPAAPQQAAPPPKPVAPTVVDQLIAAIKSYKPAGEVAGAIVQLAKGGEKDPVPAESMEFITAVTKAGGIEELAKQHLGDWWKEARNLMYMRTLLVEVERQGAAAGVWENPEEEEGDEEDAETVEEAPPPGEDA